LFRAKDGGKVVGHFGKRLCGLFLEGRKFDKRMIEKVGRFYVLNRSRRTIYPGLDFLHGKGSGGVACLSEEPGNDIWDVWRAA
jgi:hypothetical protein